MYMDHMMIILSTFFYILYLIILAGISIASAIACLMTMLSGQFVSMATFGYLSIMCALAVIFSRKGFIAMRRERRKNAELKRLHPASPWRWRVDWNENRSRQNEAISLRGYWFYASVFNICATAVILYSYSFSLSSRILLSDPPVDPMVVLILISIGFGFGALYLTFDALKNTIRARKTGSPHLVLNQIPIRPGDELMGLINVSQKLAGDMGFTLTLRCSNFNHSSGYQAHRISLGSYRVLWEETKTIYTDIASDNPHESTIPVLFNIPKDATQDNSGNAGSAEIRWTLTLTSAQTDRTYSASFGIPIFETDEKPIIVKEFAFERELFHPSRQGSKEEFHGHRIYVIDHADGSREYHFPAARNAKKLLGQSFVTFALGVGFVATLFIDPDVKTVFVWIVLGSAFLLNAAILPGIFTRRIITLVSKERISITEKAFLRPTKHSDILAADIVSIHAKRGWDANVYDIVVSPKRGKSSLAANAIPTMGIARRLVHDMRERLGRADITSPEFQTLASGGKKRS